LKSKTKHLDLFVLLSSLCFLTFVPRHWVHVSSRESIVLCCHCLFIKLSFWL
jgi:hypothetical protein